MISEINVNLKEMLVQELISIAQSMREEQDLNKKMFLFSATYGVADRVMRLSYDRELLMVTLVLNHTYNSFMTRLTAYSQGDRVVPLTNDHFDRLTDLTEALSKAVRDGTPTQSILERLNELAFITTGAGHYMSITKKMG